MKKIIALFAIFFGYSNDAFSQDQPIKIEGTAQGTTYHISYYDESNRNFQPEIETLLKNFDLSVSTYIPNSVISRINRNEKNIILDSYFITCFKKAKEVWKNTNGAFDPTVYPLVNAFGFGPEKKKKLSQKEIDSVLQFVGFDLIELKGKKIVKKDPRVRLDFNAFAQGYSVDVISQFLISKKCSSFMVEIGGEVYAKGKKSNGDKWSVGIEKPIDNKETQNPINVIAEIEDLAIASSGDYRRFFIEDGIKYAHHIDPKTGYPTKNNLLSASVFAKDCITSDAYATGILVMGLGKAKLFLEKHPEIQVYLIYSDENGNYAEFQTSQMESILKEVE